jgi:hypothetical protein
MKETPKTITEWNKKTFPKLTEKGQWLKLLEEFKEYRKAGNFEDAIKEYADMVIVSCVLDERFNNPVGWFILSAIDENDEIAKLIDEAVDEKMKINRKRKWIYKNGVYRHIGEE